MASREDVVNFLGLLKGCIMLDRMAVRDREKNRQALIDLGITPAERREVLLGLEPEDYMAGPKPDDEDNTKDVWEFGKFVASIEVYIKLRVVKAPGKQGVYHALVWSFHPAEFRMKYPLKGGGS
ncbi:MAG: type II toxin-antitoxin system MqsR family toxin [Planctomycetes bacterium]|nr:type II toxin-antitoxin system MqsR family toxin [Planctomycetota bacterium]